MQGKGGAETSENELVQRLNRAFAALGAWSFDHRWLVVGICLGLFAGSVYLAGWVGVDTSYEAYFDEGDRTYLAYEAYRDDFGSDEVAYIGYELPGVEHGPWNLEAMKKLASLTEALEEVPFVYEVTTLANAELTQGVPDGIEISKLWDEMPETQDELLALREAYLAKPMLVGGIINEEADFGAIIIEMDRSSTDPPEEIVWDEEIGADDLENVYPQVSDSVITEILARPEYADFHFFYSGDVPLNAYWNRVMGTEPLFLLGISLALISGTLLVFFRSIVSVVTPVLVLILSFCMMMALMGVVGWEMGLMFLSTPPLIMAIGVAHSVHILSEFRGQFVALGDRREALVQTLYLVGTPCLLTSVTTAVGFLSMSFVPIATLSHSARYTAGGVMAAFVLSFTLLMALLSFGSPTPRKATTEAAAADAKGGAGMIRMLTRAADANIKHSRVLIGLFTVFTLFCAVGATRVQVDTNWLEDFWEDSPIRIDTMRVDDEMGGTTNIIYLFDSGESDRIKEPAVLREIERLQDLADGEGWLVRKSYSIVDIVKDLNQVFHEGDPAYYRIPDTREEIAQYLLLYESSGGEEAEEYVSSDYRHANLELRLRLAPTSETAKLVERLDEVLGAEGLRETKLSLTGIGALWLKLMDYILESQFQGFVFAFSVITLMMIAIFRSIKIGLISMIPNLTPVLVALGAMGWFGISLDYNKVMIAAIAIGISVDDTIHLMMRFHHEFERHGSYVKALRSAMGDVGRALVITSIALVLGFLVFGLSELRSQATYGGLLAAALVTALIADFFFMPALVLELEPFGPEGQRAQPKEGALREAA
jgi:predicted RND superfamily exporter protein